MKEEVAFQLARVLAIIFVAGAGWIAFAWRRSGGRGARIWTTYATEFVILPAIFVPAYLGGYWLLAAVLALGAVTSWELYGALETRGERPYKVAGVALGAIAIAGARLRPEVLPYVFAGAVLLFSALLAARPAAEDAFLARIRSSLVGVLYPSLCVAHFIAIADLEEGFAYVVFYFCLTEITDVTGHLVGGAVGKRKLWPSLSPNKTVFGSVAGVFAAVGLGWIMDFAVPEFSLPHVIGAALLLSIGGQAGDLFASWIKRRAGIKDFSSLIPTQGGVLDIYDSFILASALFYYYLLFIAL